MGNIFYDMGIGALNRDAILKLKSTESERTKQAIIINWGYEYLRLSPFTPETMKIYIIKTMKREGIKLKDGFGFFYDWHYRRKENEDHY